MTKLTGGRYDPGLGTTPGPGAQGALDPGAQAGRRRRRAVHRPLDAAGGAHLVPDADGPVAHRLHARRRLAHHLRGGGENGKTTVMTGCSARPREYYTLVSDRVLLAQPGQHPTELMDLRGAPVRADGGDPRGGPPRHPPAQVDRRHPADQGPPHAPGHVTFDATHTLWINTNHVPQVDATDHATWRRLKLMPWPLQVRQAADRGPDDRQVRQAPKANWQATRVYGRPSRTIPHPLGGVHLDDPGRVEWYKLRASRGSDPEIVQQAVSDWRARSDVAFLFCPTQLVPDEKVLHHQRRHQGRVR